MVMKPYSSQACRVVENAFGDPIQGTPKHYATGVQGGAENSYGCVILYNILRNRAGENSADDQQGNAARQQQPR